MPKDYQEIERIVEEFQIVCPHTSPHCEKERCFGACNQDIYVDWLRQSLTAERTRHAEEKERLVRALLKELERDMEIMSAEIDEKRDSKDDYVLGERNGIGNSQALLRHTHKTIAAKFNIDVND
jgi:uncharacterized protein YlxP (DUF503 family)